MSREKAIEICNNLEQSIDKAMSTIILSNNAMFTKPSVTKGQLRKMRDELIKNYKLTKKELK